MSGNKCIIILSEKSSGSSAFQNLLTTFVSISHIEKTRHSQNETLFWTKAASLLEKPQVDMVDSEIPLPRDQARRELITLLQENLDHYSPPDNDRELIMQGWRALCLKYSPIFLEKSPHHLCQWSAIELILEFIEQNQDIDFLIIGLIRNPLSTIRSQFRRWGTWPDKVEKQWVTAYRNLLRLKPLLGDKLVIVRYEDMVISLQALQPVLDFCGVKTNDADQNHFHNKSLNAWQGDRWFGFELSQEAKSLAGQFGYPNTELENTGFFLWPVYRQIMHYFLKAKKLDRKLKNKIKAMTHFSK